MSKFLLFILCLVTPATVFSQETLSKEEKAQREKNINAGNPFAKFGSKAKVATLSKGKYLEVHDLDSIVTIGSVRFHVDRNEIVGYVQPDTLLGEYARPLADTPSRWLSVDPLAEEFPSWSPYTFVYNSPLKYTDPTGMAPVWKPNRNGDLIAEKGDNTKTLAAYLDKSVADVGKRFTQNGKSIGENHQFKEGEKVTLNNNMTEAIDQSNGVTAYDRIFNNKNADPDPQDGYMCQECVMSGSTGGEIGNADTKNFSKNFKEVGSFDDLSFGKGAVYLRMENGEEHYMLPYGKSNDGTVNVFSKEGVRFKPAVYPLGTPGGDPSKPTAINIQRAINGVEVKEIKYFQYVGGK